MDRERGAIHRPSRCPAHDGAGVIDLDQIISRDLLEVHTERVDPEQVRIARITHGDVAGYAFVEAEATEDPKCECQALLTAKAFLDFAPFDREGMRLACRHGAP